MKKKTRKKFEEDWKFILKYYAFKTSGRIRIKHKSLKKMRGEG